MNEKKARHWEKLIAGEQIQRSEAKTQNGRLDFRGLVLPDVSLTRAVSSGSSRFALAVGLIKLQGLVWDGIDLTGSSLEHLRFYDCEIVNCLFDHSNCCDWRMWRTSFRNCSFRCADLRDAALGAVLSGKRNVFSDVDFSEANLSGTGHTSAEFSRCLFINTKLKKVDFQGSVFTDCIFEGELDEVLFYDLGFNAKDLSPNELLRTDFGKAKFRHVEFRHLDLDTVRLPVSDDHIVLKRRLSPSFGTHGCIFLEAGLTRPHAL